MALSEYLRLERGLRAKQPEEHPPDQAEQVPHRAFITRFGPSRQADGICDSDSSTSFTPRACSRSAICFETAGWLIRNSFAAAENDRRRANAEKARNRASSCITTDYTNV